jgi:tetratricopeptide (TPR) repeat protein
MCACICAFSGFAMREKGLASVRGLLPVWVLLVLCVLPAILSSGLLGPALERVAVECGSRILDLVGIRHVVNGNAMELASGRIVEVSSGVVNAFCVLICTAVLWSLVRRQRVIHGSLLLASSVFWACVVVVVQIVALGVLQSRLGWGGELGASREIIAYAIAIGGVLLMLCTDQLWTFLFEPIPDYEFWYDELQESYFPGNPLVGWWNHAFSGMPLVPLREFDPPLRPDLQEVPIWPRIFIEIPQRAFHATVGFALEWWHSRRWVRFAAGSLAVVTAGTALVVAHATRHVTPSHLAPVYRSTADGAMRRNDVQTAKVALRKLANLDYGGPETHYHLAVAAAKDGDRVKARGLMQQLASPDRPGYAAAHLWLANDLLSGTKSPTTRDVRVAQQHLEQSLKTAPDNAAAHVLLSQNYLRLRQQDLATTHLVRAVDQYPQLNLALARIHKSQGRPDEATSAAQQAADHFQKLAEPDPGKVQAWLQWTNAEMLLGNYAEAESILTRGLAASGKDEYRHALANLCVAWSDAAARQEKPDLGQQLELLGRALSFVPDHRLALARLAALSAQEGPEKQAAETALKDVLASGKAPAIVHIVLGSAAAAQKDYATALSHLEQANKLRPDMPWVLNNLAWVLAHREPPDYDRALELINAALKKLPRSPEFHDTRGQIFLKMSRWKEAATDLELALAAFPDRAELHRALAKVYDQLGDPDLARRHTAQAEADEQEARTRQARPVADTNSKDPGQESANLETSELL